MGAYGLRRGSVAARREVEDYLAAVAAGRAVVSRPPRGPAWRVPVVPGPGKTGGGEVQAGAESKYDALRSSVPVLVPTVKQAQVAVSPAPAAGVAKPLEIQLPRARPQGHPSPAPTPAEEKATVVPSAMPARGGLLAQGKPAAPLPPRPEPAPEPPDPDGLGTLARAFPEIARAHELRPEAISDGHRILRGGREIARVRRKAGEPAVVQLNRLEGPGLWDKAVLGSTGKEVAVYLEHGTRRKNAAELREWKSGVISAAVAAGPEAGEPARMDTPKGRAQFARAQELSRLGGLPDQIRAAVKRGDLALGDGEEMMQKLWGKTLKPQDPRGAETFREWLTAAPRELRKEWFGATSSGDVEAQNALMNLYVNDWYRKNSSQPGVTRDLMQRVREDLTGKDARIFKEKFTGAVNGLNDFLAGTVGSAAGMVGGIDEDLRNARMAAFSPKARAALVEKMKIRGRGTTNTLRGWAHFIDKNSPFSDTGRKDQEAQSALGDLKRKIDVLDLQQNGWKEEDQKQISEAMAAAREKLFALHEVDQEKGFEIGRDDVDAGKDPVLFKALDEYIHTGDPNAWQRFRDRMFADQGTRQLDAQLEEKLRGMNPWQAAYTGGANLDFANLGVEAASTALTAGLGKALGAEMKLLKAAQGAGKGAARGGGALARIGALGRGLAGAGEASGGFHRLGRTLASGGKLRETLGRWVKDTALEAPVGAAAEAISEAGDKRATGESMWKAAGTGLLAEVAMGPLMGGAIRAVQAGAKLIPARKADAEFADYQRAQGAQELSPEDLEAATGPMDAERRKAIVAEYEAAQREQEAARVAEGAATVEPSTTSAVDAGPGQVAGNPSAAVAPAPQGERVAGEAPPREAGATGASAADKAAGGAGDSALFPAKPPALPAEAGNAPAGAGAIASQDGSTKPAVDEAERGAQTAPALPQETNAGIEGSRLREDGGIEGRGQTAPVQDPAAAEAGPPQSQGETPMHEGRAPRLPNGGQASAAPEHAARARQHAVQPNNAEVEASNGSPQGAEIDSAPMLGLRFEPWDEYSYREIDHPAAGRRASPPRKAAEAFRDTLRIHHGAVGVRLLRLPDRGAAQGAPGLRGDLLSGLVRGFERAFGKRVVFYKAASSTKPLPRGGLIPRQYPNYIAVNANGPFSLFFVLGHELGHAIDRQQPELYAAAKREVLALLRGRNSYIAREGLERWYQAEKLDNEVFNDVLGHFFRDAKFWQELGQRNGGLTARIFTVFSKVVEKMLAAFDSKRGGRDAESMLADHLVEIRTRVADMVDEYRRRGEFPAHVPEPPSAATSALERLDGEQAKPEGTTTSLVDDPVVRGKPSHPSPAEVDAAAKGPDARKRLGDVRAGRLHALEAYRFYNDKLTKKGRLSPEEQVTYDRAAQALAEAVGRESQAAEATTPTNRGTQAWRETDASAPDAQAVGLVDQGRGNEYGAEVLSPSRAVPVDARPAQASRVADGVEHAVDAGPATSSIETAGQMSAADPGSAATPSRDAGRAINGAPATRVDVHAAATAPDARRRLGDVRDGRLHALEAYRFLSDKLQKMGRLDPAETVTYERAAQALAEAVGREMKESQANSEWLQGPQRPEDYSTDKLERYMREGERSELLKSLAPELLKHLEALANATRTVEGIRSQTPSTKPNVPGGPPNVSAMLAAANALKAAETAKAMLIEAGRVLVAPLSIFNVTIGFGGYPHLQDLARQGAEIVYRYVRGDLLPTRLEILHDPHSPPGHLPGKIRFSESHSPLQVGHEIMHEVEILNRAIHVATLDFFERRTKTGGFRMLSEYTGKPEHAEVKIYLDKWDENGGSEYAGRLYEPRDGESLQATEILPVGLERLHANPLLFLLNDPEYFELILTLIHKR